MVYHPVGIYSNYCTCDCYYKPNSYSRIYHFQNFHSLCCNYKRLRGCAHLGHSPSVNEFSGILFLYRIPVHLFHYFYNHTTVV